MRMMMKQLSLLGVLAALPLLGCGDDDADPVPQPDSAKIRVVHASPDAPAVDVYVAGNATPVISGLAYGQSSPYLTVDAGSYDFEVRPAGAAPTSAPVYSTGALALAADAQVTAVATGFVASTDAANSFRVLPLAEQFVAGGAGKVQLRIVHGSPDAPTVGIDVGNDNPAAPEVAALARFADTGAAGVALPAAAALNIGITAGGARVTAFTTPALPDGANLFVIAVGRLGDLPRQSTGFSLLAVGPDGVIGRISQDPTVYAVHASPDAPAVDIRENTSKALLLGNVSYGQMAPIQVPPGTYTLAFYGAGANPGTAPAATASTGALEAGQRYLALATGFLTPIAGEAPFQLLAAKEEFELDASNARVRAIHASPDAPAVDIGPVTGGQLTSVAYNGVTFGQSSAAAGLQLAPGTLSLGVAADNTINSLATFPVTVSAGLRAFALATGALSVTAGSGERPFALRLVNTSVSPWTIAAVNPTLH
jgi:Domain of unknown function (DUF4397)